VHPAALAVRNPWMIQKLLLTTGGVFCAILIAAFLFSQWQARRIAAANPPRGEFVDVDGARIHLTRSRPAGEAKGTIVLVHGASGNEADLRLALGERMTAAGYQVISVDRPGHGWSERGDGSSDPAMQARQIRQAIEKAGVRQAVVAGHSLAGALTLQLALDHTDLVNGVVLIAPVSHPWPGGVAAYYKITAMPVIGPLFTNTVMMPIALSLIGPSLETVFSPQQVPESYRERTGVDLVLRPKTFRANAQDVDGMYTFVTREQARYPEISMPVEIVTGDKDTIVLTHIHSYGSARDIPGARLHVMEGVGHSPHWARPDEVAARIIALAQKASEGKHAGR
jgi:pimeloyl-ACP methyl ester carboxylesterase